MLVMLPSAKMAPPVPMTCFVYYACLLVISASLVGLCDGATVNHVSIEENFIDLDEEPSFNEEGVEGTGSSNNINNHNNHINHKIIFSKPAILLHQDGANPQEAPLQMGRGHILTLDQSNAITVDDEDDTVFGSGSGSGSGDFDLDLQMEKGQDMLTPTTQKPAAETKMENTTSGQTSKSSKNTIIKHKTIRRKGKKKNLKDAKLSDNDTNLTTLDKEITIDSKSNEDKVYLFGDEKEKHLKIDASENDESASRNTVFIGKKKKKMMKKMMMKSALRGDDDNNVNDNDNDDDDDEDDADDAIIDWNQASPPRQEITIRQKKSGDVGAKLDGDKNWRLKKGRGVKDTDYLNDEETNNSNNYKYLDIEFDDGENESGGSSSSSSSSSSSDAEEEEEEDDGDDDDEEYYYDENKLDVDNSDKEEDGEDLESSYGISNAYAGAGGDRWSKWRKFGAKTKVRVTSCEKGEQTEESGDSCSGVKVEVKFCGATTKKKGRCGKPRKMVDASSGGCGNNPLAGNDSDGPSPASSSSSSPIASPIAAPPEAPPSPSSLTKNKACHYSLYDKTKRKYVFVRWSHHKLVAQSKVKRWCKNDDDQYILMSTPTERCRKLYRDLCRVSQSCKPKRAPRERGDFAEGCWRGLVFGDMLPVGLSNRQTIIYFICQRYSSLSSIGRLFGYKETHFGTLYDTKLRSPVLSLHKMVQVGDETWPESEFLIEHGLVEQKKDAMWLFNRHKKGIVTLHDLDRCYDDQPCDLGKYQVLPGDYHRKSDHSMYTPTPLVWPEWMDPSPDSRMATLSMTNTVPLTTSLNDEWHSAIKAVRDFAISKCGVPYNSDPTLRPLGQLSSHRSNKSALYLVSGAIPSASPTKTTGRDVHVPSHLWVAGCCVMKFMVKGGPVGEEGHANEAYVEKEDDDASEKSQTKISSFSFFIKNEAGSRVSYASVFQLELLLQDFYKVKATDPEVALFPGQERACSDLKNNVSGWFQKK